MENNSPLRIVKSFPHVGINIYRIVSIDLELVNQDQEGKYMSHILDRHAEFVL